MKYIYRGPLSSVTLRDADHPEQDIEVILRDGQAVELPEDHDYTQTLLAQDFLTPVKDEMSAAKASKTTKAKE